MTQDTRDNLVRDRDHWQHQLRDFDSPDGQILLDNLEDVADCVETAFNAM